MSTRWKNITEADILAYQPAPMVDALKTAALAEDQRPPLDDAIQNITAEIRSVIKTAGLAVDRNETKIPGELLKHAIALVIAYAKPRINQPLSDDEKENARKANEWLLAIAKGQIKVAAPDDPEAAEASTQTSGGAQLVRPSKTVAKRGDYSGL